MAIETQCHGCGKRLRVGEQFAGRQARCPECGYVYTVPEAASTEASPLDGGQAPKGGEQPLSEPTQTFPQTAAQTLRTSSTASTAPAGGPLPQSPAGDDDWYMKTPEGQIYGPVSGRELDEWVRQGRVSDDCQLRPGEYGVWDSAAAKYPHLAAAHTHARSTGGTYANPYSSPQTNVGYGGYGSVNRYVRPHRGGLIITFAIIGWALSCPIFSIMAWSMGTSDMNQMRTGVMDNSGMGMTQAGQILGMIHTCLYLLGLGLALLIILCAAAAEGM